MQENPLANGRHEPPLQSTPAEIKTCCATIYQSDWVQLLLGDSFHPGGTSLTRELGAALQLGPGQRVLDVASGPGTSAIVLARQFGCSVLGIEYGHDAVAQATQAAKTADVSHLVTFAQGDAECLPVATGSMDAVLCECAFCTFPNKAIAATEFRRVLKTGGSLGLSDLTRNGEIPKDLQGLLAWISCIADAQPLEEYVRYLTKANLVIQHIEQRDQALSEMVREIQTRLLGAELLVKLKKTIFPQEINFEQARAMVKAATNAIQTHRLGYATITATAS